ncbi:sugar/nucleoside kinase (ribokinase family) [Frondihabitans sp. PhB188]|uniref:carbohydrate kinase family protein n=1 Tax=Frondihabitans sp. PhB188 TaxID=2485200 RepID=UPI000F497EAD|nr:PfkB family carbohydrate kinase [Frondihabitans sp. PhB188]ROQ39443.1 sugar/nucleoside kinase (ribokinase family) [Frondihabitans sp. PhB188]
MPRTAPASASPSGRVLVVGDVLDDVIVAPSKRPVQNTDVGARIQHRAGGSAANTAAWLGTQGVRVEFLGRVGVGDVQRHAQLLANAGVVPHLEYAPDGHTGTVVITLDGTNRTMLSDRGASAGLDLDGVSDELIGGTAIVHTTGYTVVASRTPVSFRRLVTRVRSAGALVSVDPATSGFIEDFGAAEFLDVTGGADLFFPSLDEGRLLTGLRAPDEVLRALLPRYGVVAMFLPDGSAIAGRTGSKLVHSPRVATRLVDPVGAGDAFRAGFLGGWLHSPSLALSTRKGVKVSAQALAVVGGRPSR